MAGLCSVALVASAVVAFDRSRQPIDASGDPVFGVRAGEPEATDTSDDPVIETADQTNSTQGLVTVPLGPTASTAAPVDAVRTPVAPRPTSAPTPAPTTPTVAATPTTDDSTTVTDPTSSETSETSETTETTESTTSTTEDVTTSSVDITIDPLPTITIRPPGRGGDDD